MRHSHACTDRADSGQGWTLNVFLVRNWDGTIQWNANYSGHQHTDEWCGWAQPSHEFFPEVFVLRGSNQFHVATQTRHCIPGQCYTTPYEELVLWNQ